MYTVQSSVVSCQLYVSFEIVYHFFLTKKKLVLPALAHSSVTHEQMNVMLMSGHNYGNRPHFIHVTVHNLGIQAHKNDKYQKGE